MGRGGCWVDSREGMKNRRVWALCREPFCCFVNFLDLLCKWLKKFVSLPRSVFFMLFYFFLFNVWVWANLLCIGDEEYQLQSGYGFRVFLFLFHILFCLRKLEFFSQLCIDLLIECIFYMGCVWNLGFFLFLDLGFIDTYQKYSLALPNRVA